jgi:hypothetical protein
MPLGGVFSPLRDGGRSSTHGLGALESGGAPMRGCGDAGHGARRGGRSAGNAALGSCRRVGNVEPGTEPMDGVEEEKGWNGMDGGIAPQSHKNI